MADDDDDLLQALCRGLGARDYAVTAATDGLEAAELVAGGGFDAVVSDVMMPGMTGIELLRAIRATSPDLPVLLMTGAPDVTSAVEAVHYGATDYLVKPFLVADLKQKLKRAVQLHDLARAKRDALVLLESGRPEPGDRAGLEVAFDRALASLWLAYQPIVDVRSRTVFGYESLMRSSEASLPHPGAVLGAAERLGRLDELGRAIRSKAVEPMGRADPSTALLVNLHSSDLRDETLLDASTPLGKMAGRVVLEITERASLDSVMDVRGKVKALRELGFRIAVDDLGAGYAGLTSFAQLEPELVKLDMSLVRDVDTNPVKQKLVRSMSKLCREMGIIVVAEGIETPAERDCVVDLGCDLLQGYLFARPDRPFPAVTW